MKTNFSVCRFFKKYFSPHIFLLFVFAVFIFMHSLLSVAVPSISGSFIDFLSGYTQSRTDANETLFSFCVTFVIVNFLIIVLGYIINLLYAVLRLKISYHINTDAIKAIQHCAFEKQNTINPAQLTQQIQSDSTQLILFTFGFIQNSLKNIVKFITPLYIIARINKSILIIIFFLLVAYIILFTFFKKKLYRVNLEQKKETTIYYSNFQEQIALSKYIQIHGLLKVFCKRLDPQFSKYYEATIKMQKSQYCYNALDTIVFLVGQILLFIVGGHAILNSEISIGDFTVLSTYFSMALTSIRYFYSLGSSAQKATVSYERIAKVNALEPLSNGEMTIRHICDIKMDHIIFGYKNKNPLYDDFTYRFSSGHIYGLKGQNGAGKTTLFHLLIGLGNLSAPNQGTIYYNDIDISNLDMNHTRNCNIGYVEQDYILDSSVISSLFTHDSIKKLSSPKFKVLIENFKLEPILQKLQDVFLDTATNNCGFSGGETQKVAIIRELIKRPDVLLLDEPTSAMDANSTKAFCDYLEANKEEQITIIISHDDSVLGICDQIIEL